MSNIKNWSKTPANNNSAAPNGAPEGWAPSAVNNTIRQQMADHRTQWEEAPWFDWGHVPVRQGNNSFIVSISNTVASTIYTAGRRLKMNDATTIVGEVVATGVSGSNTLVSVSSSNLTASLTSLSISILDPAVPSWPLASKRDMETTTISSTSALLVTPSVQKFHPIMPKSFGTVWFSTTGTNYTILNSWNVSTISRSATGVVRVNLSHTLTASGYQFGIVNARTETGITRARYGYIDPTTGGASFKVRMSIYGSMSAVDAGFDFVLYGPGFAD